MGEYQRKRAARASAIRSCGSIGKALIYGVGPDGRKLDAARFPSIDVKAELKGIRDGNCNRTACQAPLKGRAQWTMPNYSKGGFYHYCEVCERDFTAWDRRIGAPIRCTPIIETGAT